MAAVVAAEGEQFQCGLAPGLADDVWGQTGIWHRAKTRPSRRINISENRRANEEKGKEIERGVGKMRKRKASEMGKGISVKEERKFRRAVVSGRDRKVSVGSELYWLAGGELRPTPRYCP